MMINLSDVLSEQHNTIDVTVSYDMETFQNSYGTFAIVSKEPVHVVVEHIKDRELRILADTKMTMRLPCDRCLKDTLETFVLHIDKLVDLGKSEAELTEEFDESNFIEGYKLDVEQLLTNQMHTNWPAKVLCAEDCAGLCSICGVDLNQGNCDCESTEGDPRMTLIRDLFKNHGD